MNNAGGNLAGNTTGSNFGNEFREKRPHGYQLGSIQQFDPRQMQLFQQMFQHVGPDSYLSRLAGGDQSMFAEMEAPAMRQFQELQGQLGSRFSGAGMGARRGSGFQNAGAQATQDFAMQLQANRQNLQRQALQDLMGISESLLGQRPYERTLIQKEEKQSPWGGLIGAGVGGAAGFFGSGGNPMMALKGAQFGHSLGSSF